MHDEKDVSDFPLFRSIVSLFSKSSSLPTSPRVVFPLVKGSLIQGPDSRVDFFKVLLFMYNVLCVMQVRITMSWKWQWQM